MQIAVCFIFEFGGGRDFEKWTDSVALLKAMNESTAKLVNEAEFQPPTLNGSGVKKPDEFMTQIDARSMRNYVK